MSGARPEARSGCPGGYAASDSAAIRPTASAAGTTSWGPRNASRGESTRSPQGGGGAKTSRAAVATVAEDAHHFAQARHQPLALRGRWLGHAEDADHHVLAGQLEVDVAWSCSSAATS